MTQYANDEVPFADIMATYEVVMDGLARGRKKIHADLTELNRAVGAEWVQPAKKKGPSSWKKLYDYLRRKVSEYGEPKTHFEPTYSEVEKKEREEMKEALKGFEEYNPKDSKKYGVKDRVMDIGAAIAKVKGYGGKTEDDYVELTDIEESGEPNVADEDRESLKKTLAGFEKYVPGQTYEKELETGVAKSSSAAGAELYIKKRHGNYDEPVKETARAENKTGVGLKLRKSYGLEAHGDKLLGRRKISDIEQYAPEHSSR